LKLGRIFRQEGLQTEIGRWQVRGRFGEVAAEGNCLSACAYAFLGGKTRFVPEGNRIGFHQFAFASRDETRLTEETRSVAVASSQIISAALINYILEMGVDARIFTRATEAASDQFFFPSREQLAEYDLVTRRGFAPFFLEPFKIGVIAASKRLDAPRLNDEVTQLTAYCSNGAARFLLSAPRHGLSKGMEFFDPGIRLVPATLGSVSAAGANVRIWSTGDFGYVELSFAAADIAPLYQADAMTVFLEVPRVNGGTYRASSTLSAMDKKMLQSAFTHCI
jgi:hypothetical protein